MRGSIRAEVASSIAEVIAAKLRLSAPVSFRTIRLHAV